MPNAQPKRCSWVNVDQPVMLEYHDREWGVPAHDDRTHFEFLILEAAQAGLNWTVVLNKRDGYRRAFSDFDPEKVARYSAARVDKLTTDRGIIRNRMKIAAAVKNARAFLAVQEELGSFDAYCWQFVDGRPRQNRWKTMRQIPTTTPESDAFSRDLKRRGFSFVGSTTIYGHMQAVGMVVRSSLLDAGTHRLRGVTAASLSRVKRCPRIERVVDASHTEPSAARCDHLMQTGWSTSVDKAKGGFSCR